MKFVRSLLVLTVPMLLLTGCPDPEAAYDDFQDRYSKVDSGVAVDCSNPAPCTAIPQPGELDGDYFFAFAASLELSKPMVFLATITSAAGASGTEMTWSLQALDWSDRVSPAKNPPPPEGDGSVPPPIVLPGIAIDGEGMIDADLPPLDVVGSANPFSHTPITADVSSLSGRFCAGETFFSGQFDGKVTKPIPIELAGSSWTLTKVTGPSDYPEPPPIDCLKTEAAPVGTWQ
jgi:hypothetical protein